MALFELIGLWAATISQRMTNIIAANAWVWGLAYVAMAAVLLIGLGMQLGSWIDKLEEAWKTKKKDKEVSEEKALQ